MRKRFPLPLSTPRKNGRQAPRKPDQAFAGRRRSCRSGISGTADAPSDALLPVGRKRRRENAGHRLRANAGYRISMRRNLPEPMPKAGHDARADAGRLRPEDAQLLHLRLVAMEILELGAVVQGMARDIVDEGFSRDAPLAETISGSTLSSAESPFLFLSDRHHREIASRSFRGA